MRHCCFLSMISVRAEHSPQGAKKMKTKNSGEEANTNPFLAAVLRCHSAFLCVVCCVFLCSLKLLLSARKGRRLSWVRSVSKRCCSQKFAFCGLWAPFLFSMERNAAYVCEQVTPENIFCHLSAFFGCCCFFFCTVVCLHCRIRFLCKNLLLKKDPLHPHKCRLLICVEVIFTLKEHQKPLARKLGYLEVPLKTTFVYFALCDDPLQH